jgi:molecular chaperone GrpE (heat shock protein)
MKPVLDDDELLTRVDEILEFAGCLGDDEDDELPQLRTSDDRNPESTSFDRIAELERQVTELTEALMKSRATIRNLSTDVEECAGPLGHYMKVQ